MMRRCIGLCFVILLGWPGIARTDTIARFSGDADFLQERFHLILDLKDNSRVSVDFTSAQNTNSRLTAKVEHLKTPGFDLSTEFESIIETVKKEDSQSAFWRGTVESRYSLINYKPVRELTGNFEIKEGRLYLNNLSWEGVRLDGFIDLLVPHALEVFVDLDEISMNDFSLLMGCPEDSSKLFGFVSGQFKLSGFLNRLFMDGKVISSNGIIGSLQYDSLQTRFSGIYPNVEMQDSSVTQTDGLSFQLQGSFDLSEGCNLAKGMASLKTSPIVDENSLMREWTIKRKHEEGRSGTTEFKYRLKAPQDRLPSQDKDDGILGVEHKIKF